MKRLSYYGLGLLTGLLLVGSSVAFAKPVCTHSELLYNTTFSKAKLVQGIDNLNIYQLIGTSFQYKQYAYQVSAITVCNKDNLAVCKNKFANTYRATVSQAGKLLKAHYSLQPKDGYLTLTCIYQVPKSVSGIDAVIATVKYKQ